jgi:hypothetical protein
VEGKLMITLEEERSFMTVRQGLTGYVKLHRARKKEQNMQVQFRYLLRNPVLRTRIRIQKGQTAHRKENNEEINFFQRAECSLWRAGGFSWNWEVPLSQEKLKIGYIQKKFIGTVYVYYCEIFLII